MCNTDRGFLFLFCIDFIEEETEMKKKVFLLFSVISLFFSACLLRDAIAFSSLAEKGPYFVRALHVTIPLRDDLVWGPVFGNFYWNRNTIGVMRYNALIYYPAINEVRTSDQYSIFFPPDTSGAPYPAVVFIQGANVYIEQYAWLFEHIASYGYIVLAVTEFMPSGGNLEGQFQNLFPQGTATPSIWQTSMTIPDAITYLERINTSVVDPLPPAATVATPPDPWDRTSYLNVVRNPRGPSGDDLNHSLFEGMVNTNKIILAGHSFGGYIALMCANTTIQKPPRPEGGSFTNHVAGCIVYGAHTFAASGAGYSSPINVPLLMLGGEKDGVAAGPIGGIEKSGYERIKYTFNNYVPASSDNSRYLLGIKGANHLSIGTKPDPMVDRSFLDEKDGIISTYLAHQVIQEKVMAFLQYYIKNDANALPILTGSGSDPFIFDYAVK